MGSSGDGGPATSAALNFPTDVAVDTAGNIYIADSNNNRVRKVAADGTISTFAGGGTADPGDGGPATAALLKRPVGLALDPAGNLYIAEGVRIRKVTPAGIISTVIGGGSFRTADGVPATTTLITPDSVAIDPAGNIYATDNSDLIRKASPNGIISTVSGGFVSATGDGGPANRAGLNAPSGMAFDASGNLYFADRGNARIRKVDTAGIITTFAGTTRSGYAGDGGPATDALLGRNTAALMQGVAFDRAGNLYFSDPVNNRVRMVNSAGIITTVAGSAVLAPGNFGDGGPATAAVLNRPGGIFIDGSGNLYIADVSHNKIRKVTPGSTGTGGQIRPAISTTNGVVNGASFLSGVVANSWVTIKGTNLAPKTDNWNNSVIDGQLPTSLDGVSVSIGGKAAYIYVITPTQINAVAPDIPAGPTTVTVTTPDGTSTPVNATASVYGPAFFEWPGNQPVATRPDYTYVAREGTFPGAATLPAKPGEVIILWATGFGPTTPAAPTGVAIPADNPYPTSAVPVVTLSNARGVAGQAQVLGAALAAGSAGLYQVAVQLPTVTDGNYSIRASIGGALSPVTTMITICAAECTGGAAR
jgi:uncharacterized protein (TIGR03437 family)